MTYTLKEKIAILTSVDILIETVVLLFGLYLMYGIYKLNKFKEKHMFL